MRTTKISELPAATTLTGLYTLGTDSNAQSVKVSLEFVQTAADSANAAATAATTAIDECTAATTAANTAAGEANEAAGDAATAAVAANEAAERAEEAAEQIEFASKIYTALCPAITKSADNIAVWNWNNPVNPRTTMVAQLWRVSDNCVMGAHISVTTSIITIEWNTDSDIVAGEYRIVIIG